MTYNLLLELNFNINSKREYNIKSGYRPGFKINNEGFYTGIVNLINLDELKPGQSCISIVSFFSDEPFSDVCIGDLIDFYEIPYKIGTSKLLQIIGWGIVSTPDSPR